MLSAQAGERLPNPRILIVDDDASIRGLLRVIAERAAVVADEAADGVRALELLNERTYDVVLLDLSMPRINGFDLVERLRAKSMRPVVIVLTALARTAYHDLDPSIVHCVVRKPFDLDMLMALIVSAAETMLRERRRTSTGSNAEERPPAGGLR